MTNNGPDGADGVELTDTLPSGLTWSLPDGSSTTTSSTSSSTTAVDSESPDVSTDAVDAEAVSDEITDEVTDEAPSCTIETGEDGAQTLRCDIGQLDADASFSVTVTSNATTTCGMVTNEDAAVTADTPDPDTENNAASASVGVTCPPPPAPTPAGFIPNGPEETTTYDVDDDHHHDDDPARRRSLSPSLRLPRRRPLLRLRRSFRRSWSARSSRPRRHLRPRFPRLRCLPRPDPSRPGPQSRRPTWCFAPSTRRRRPAESSA